MTLSQSELSELLEAVRAGGGIDVVRRGVELVLQALITAEATEFIGAQPFERSASRTNLRNGTRDRLLSTKAGDVQLQIPKVRKGSFFPAVLERRRRIDRALFAVVVTARAVVVATGVTESGDREVLGLAVGDSEDGAFWTEFLRSLRARGLCGVRLVISDAHLGLQQALATVMLGSAWQRCRVHFVRNVLARVPRGLGRDGGCRDPHDLRPARCRGGC